MNADDAAEARRLLCGAMNVLYDCEYVDTVLPDSRWSLPDSPRHMADQIFEFLHTPPSQRKPG